MDFDIIIKKEKQHIFLTKDLGERAFSEIFPTLEKHT